MRHAYAHPTTSGAVGTSRGSDGAPQQEQNRRPGPAGVVRVHEHGDGHGEDEDVLEEVGPVAVPGHPVRQQHSGVGVMPEGPEKEDGESPPSSLL